MVVGCGKRIGDAAGEMREGSRIVAAFVST